MNGILSPEAISTFVASLGIMGKGMLGIFIFMGIFYGIIKLLGKHSKAKAEQK